MNKYQFEMRAMCPIHEELTDIYAVTLTTDAIIPVEQILEFCKKYESTQIFQESLTQEIAVGLGVHVELIGNHAGVLVTSIAP